MLKKIASKIINKVAPKRIIFENDDRDYDYVLLIAENNILKERIKKLELKIVGYESKGCEE